MVPAQPTPDEPGRLKALQDYGVFDTLPEQALDDLTALAAHICGAPMAAISLLDEHRQWFKSRLNMEMTETPRTVSFCGHAIQQRDLFVVPDATHDARFADNPLVTQAPHICFYAGAPLVNEQDAALGALCVMDSKPHDLNEAQKQALRTLARQVMTHLELHRRTRKLAESEERLRLVTNNARLGLVIVDRDRRYLYANHAYAEILGLSSADIAGQRVPDVLADLYEQIRPRLDCAFAGERVSYELHKPAADGELKYYEVRYEPTKVGGDVAFVVVVIAEITERKQADLLAKRLAAIVEFSEDAIISKDLRGIVTSWNHGAEVIFGYTAGEMIGASIMRLIPEERQGEETEILASIGRGESVNHFETQRRTKDGRLIEVSITASPVKDDTGKPIGASKVARDITERKKAAQALELFRSLLDRSNDAIEVIDAATGRIIDVNETACQRLGYDRGELLSLSLADIVDSGDPSFSMRGAIEEVKRAGSRVVEGRHRRKDGSTFPIEVNVQYIEKGGAYLVAVVRDITARKQAEARIAEQAAFLDKARDAILVRDLQGGILFWNKGAERMYGWAAQEVAGRNIDQLLYAGLEKFREANELTIQKGEWHGELHHQTKDKKELVVEARWTLIRDDEGRPKSILAINTDITDRKKIEAQFMRAQRMESIGTLAGGVAHDLNNILAPILMSIDLLKSMSDKPEMIDILDTIDVSAKRGADIVQQVLSFARGIEGARIEIQPRHLFKDLENIIKNTFPKDIRLAFSAPHDGWTILGDPTQMHQVLLNLCVNARDAMPHGGALNLSMEDCELDEQYAAMNIHAAPGRYVVFVVSDSGTGIPPALIDKIFEPFFTTKPLNKGTGLGLSTVIAVVKSHGGFVNVYSEPGKGTIFKVYIPAKEKSSSAEDETKAEEFPRGNGETILLIDDEVSILAITGQTLQAFGYNVLTANDGAVAVAVYVEHRKNIAVVITDMMMPIMDGVATIHALMRLNPEVKIIAASGLNANGNTAKAAGAGVQNFLTKPYTAGTLLKTVRAILEEKPRLL